MLCKKHVPLCLMCIGGCLSYSLALYLTLAIITVMRITTPILPDTMEHNGYYILH